MRDISDVNARIEEGRDALLRRFARYDDGWWMSIMRDQEPRDEWMELVCWRQPGPVTLWKWRGNFPGNASLSEWNGRLPGKTDAEIPVQANWYKATRELLKDGVLVVRHGFEAWKADKSGDSVLSVLMNDAGARNTGIVPASELSPLIKSLRDAWLNDVQVQAFKLSTCEVSKEHVIERLNAALGG